MGKSGGSGNAAWRASRAQTAGLKRCRQCITIKRNGEQCRAPAIRGWTRCVRHGGALVIWRRKLMKAKQVKHERWQTKSTKETNLPEGRGT